MKALANLAIIIMVFMTSLGSMIYGWGLTPKSMTVIVGSYIVTILLTVVQLVLNRRD